MRLKKFFLKNRKRFFLLTLFLLAVSFGFFTFLSPKKPMVTPIPKPGHDFTIIVLPDTQFYARDYPEIFESQTQWIVDQKEARNIVFVSHLGDITQSWDEKEEWENADGALSLLDGVVPYGLLPGNHDDPETFNFYFPYQRYQNEPWYGGHDGQDNNNNYQLFSAGGMDFIILHLEFNPPEKIIDWADKILASHPNRRAIVVAHYLLDYDGFRSPEGQEIYKALVGNPSLFLILCGHVHHETKRTDLVDKRPIHQLLANYQTRPNGGNGWLRILKFVPEENKIYVETYSPYLDQFENDENSQFELDYQMS